VGCEQMLLYRELEANLHVCRNCGHHFRIGAERRLKLLFDDGVFARIRAGSLLTRRWRGESGANSSLKASFIAGLMNS
jgi:acetyl-CoA carboxylase beta subunit